MASNLIAMASNLIAMASNLTAMASDLVYGDGLQPTGSLFHWRETKDAVWQLLGEKKADVQKMLI